MVEEVRIVFDKSGDTFYILFNGAGEGRRSASPCSPETTGLKMSTVK